LVWKLLHSGNVGDKWQPERNLPDNFSELLIVGKYEGVILSITLTKMETDAASITRQKTSGWYATTTNNGCLFITYSITKYSVFSFTFSGSNVTTATCNVYYR
jgi:hypothetical protein